MLSKGKKHMKQLKNQMSWMMAFKRKFIDIHLKLKKLLTQTNKFILINMAPTVELICYKT